jgi:hypothetical protein
VVKIYDSLIVNSFHDLFQATTLPKWPHPPATLIQKLFITKILTCALFVCHYAGSQSRLEMQSENINT